MFNLMQGDCIEMMRNIPDNSVDLVLNDPPYNIGVATTRNNKEIINEWDKIDNYIDWSLTWLKECQRVLKGNGVLHFWHNDMKQIAELLEAIKRNTNFSFISFCIWHKGYSYRAGAWHRRNPEGKTALRSWFNVCEYCLHFFKVDTDNRWKETGWKRIDSNPACYRPLKEWYIKEKEQLGITDKDIAKKYTEVTGKKPHMLRHYFRDSQFAIPTQFVFENVYKPLGFSYMIKEEQDNTSASQEYKNLRQSYEEIRKDYEEMRKGYEGMRNYHRCDDMHCNVWNIKPIPSANRYHTCQKPVEILERLINVSCRPGGTVLDCFMGSGSTGVACVNTERNFIGIDIDPHWCEVARQRIEEAERRR